MRISDWSSDVCSSDLAIWSVGNETPVSDARNAFLTTLAKDAHALDDSRLVSAALLVGRKEEGGTSVFTVDDPLIPALDVMAVNAYNGWYTPDKLSDLASFVWRSPYKKLLILSEFGAGALAGEHDPARSHKFSEEFQADYYRATLDMASKIQTGRAHV